MFDMNTCKLFKNAQIKDLKPYIQIKNYPEGTLIHLEGEECSEISIVVDGEIEIVTYNYDGSSFVISTLNPGSMIGDILLFSSYKYYMGNVLTKTEVIIATISKMNLYRLFELDPTISQNFINLVCNKAFTFNTRLKLIGQKTIRDKINYYISLQQAFGQNKNKVSIGKSKEDLAKFLNIPRPSLSRELMLMKQEGIIDFDKWFIYILSN